MEKILFISSRETSEVYEDDKNLIIASGNAYAKDQLGKEIYSDKIIYNKKKFTILTSEKSVYLDGRGSKLEANEFFYDLKLKKIKAKILVKV